MDPEVSIITLTYNHARYIGDAMDSVLSQSFSRWEHIVIDDGSDDGTWDVIQSYACSEPRIRAFRQQHIGPFRMVETYNRALELSRAPLIAILEGDDLWPPHKLSTQVLYHERPIVLSYGRTEIVDQDNTLTGSFAPEWSECLLLSTHVRRLLLSRKAGILPVSVMMSAEQLRAMGGFRTSVIWMPDGRSVPYPAVDYPTFTRYLSSVGSVVRSEQVLGRWRRHVGQTTGAHEAIFVEGMYQMAVQQVAEDPSVGLTSREVFLAHQPFAAGFYLSELRKALREHDEIRAVRASRRLYYWGGVKQKLQALCGAVALQVGVDVESPFVLYQKFQQWRRAL